MKSLRFFILLLASLAALALFSPLRAGGPIPETVTDCSSDAGLRSALTVLQNGEGGEITFNCGTATIGLSAPLPEITKDTRIDGGNKVTLSGNNAVRLLNVGQTGTLTLRNIVLEKGYGNDGNGGALSSTGPVTLENVTLQYNYTPYHGGAISVFNALTVTGSTFLHNIASRGGAIYADAGGADLTVRITDTKFLDNSADLTNTGGAIHALAVLLIFNGDFSNNRAGSGGAIYSNYPVGESNITQSSFSKNKALGTAPDANGGALMVNGTRLQIDGTTFSENVGDSGGALYAKPNSRINIADSTFDHNGANNGGGLYNNGEVILGASTLAYNNAVQGGGILNHGMLSIYNSTLSGNQAFVGGGLANEGSTAGLVYVTLANNRTADVNGGAGIFNAAVANTKLALINVILADSPAGGNCVFASAPIKMVGSLSSDNTCGLPGNANNVNVMLAPLANNGGYTQTHLPKPGSPAIDHGVFTDFSNDQRGVDRPQGTTFDVGAVEVECAKPGKPVLLKPGNHKKAKGPAVALDWSDTGCARSYQIVIKLGSPQGSKIQKQKGLTASEFLTKPLVRGQTYAWRVTAINPQGKTHSDWRTFTAK